MHVYMNINLLELKDGRPYILSIPQSGQDWSEVYAALEDMKKQIEEMEKRSNEAKNQNPLPDDIVVSEVASEPQEGQ